MYANQATQGEHGRGSRMTARKPSGCLVAAEVVSDGRTGEVVFVVRLGSEGHGEVDVAAVRRRLDQLLHPGGRRKMKERETFKIKGEQFQGGV